MKKSLDIPLVLSLNEATAQQADSVLEKKGCCGDIACVNWSEYPYCPETRFFIARSEKCLYIKYAVTGEGLKAVFRKDQDPVWQDSCVEFFCKREDQDGYFNFEFNCIGTCLSAIHKTREDRTSRPSPDMLLIDRYSSLGTDVFEEKDGLFSWQLTVAIPFSLIGIKEENLPKRFFGNFYKCGDGTKRMHYVSWSPIAVESPDFHRPDFFGEFRL